MISIAIDKRPTGTGKTYSLIKYVIGEYLKGNTINWLVPNRSNTEDLFIDVLNHPVFLEEIDNICYTLLNNSSVPDEKIKTSYEVLKKTNIEDYKIKVASNFISSINVINSFYNVDVLMNDKKRGRQRPIRQPKRKLKPSDILIIDEIDRTLASLSLKEQSNKLYYLHLPKVFNIEDYSTFENHYPEFDNWLDSFIEDKLYNLKLTDNYFNTQIIKKLHKKTILDKYKDIVTNTVIGPSNKYRNYLLDSEASLSKISGKINYTKINIFLEDYNRCKNNDVETPVLYVVESPIDNSDEYKLYDSRDGKIIFFENIHKVVENLVKKDGLIIGCSATKNKHVTDLINECIEVELPYCSDKFVNPIKFTLIMYEGSDYKEKGKTLIIKESKSSSWNNRNSINNKLTTKITYLQDPNLVGSNDYSDYDTFVFDFKLHEVKQAPCHARLSFYSKIGNGFLKTDEDIKKLTSSYFSFDKEFKDQIVNKIIQAVGRLNRKSKDVNDKYVYVKDIHIFELIKEVINNKLNQELIVIDDTL